MARARLGWLLLLVVAAAAVLSAPPRSSSSSFYRLLPESESSRPHRYRTGESMNVKVNSLTSINSMVPFSYYSLPFCAAPPPEPEDMNHHHHNNNNSNSNSKEGRDDDEDNRAESLGELLTGDRVRSSPYRLRAHTNESDVFLCRTPPLGAGAVALLRKRIDEMYQVNLFLDGLPAIRDAKMKDGSPLRWTGYPVGISIGVDHFVFNHLRLTVVVHRYDDDDSSSAGSGWVVVGFEVVPCSIEHNPDDVRWHKAYELYPSKIECDPRVVSMRITEEEPIVYTYEVSFVESDDIEWSSRWDAAYGKLRTGRATPHWIAIVRPLMAVAVLSAMLAWRRRRRRRAARREPDDTMALTKTKHEELPLSPPIVCGGGSDDDDAAFRATTTTPSHPLLLCAMVGGGAQILATAAVAILFAALGRFQFFRLVSPASRGALVTTVLLLYQALGILSGYAAVRLWKTVRGGDISSSSGSGSGWAAVSWCAACFFPAMASVVLAMLNLLLRRSHSTAAIPMPSLLLLLLSWFCVSTPLALAGGFLGSMAPHVELPAVLPAVLLTTAATTDQKRRWYSPSGFGWLLLLVAGAVPFTAMSMELFFVQLSVWTGRPYQAFGFLFAVLLLVVVVCAEVSILLTYTHLRVEQEDCCRWWWRSFFASGFAGVYVFLYLTNYLVFELKGLSGTVSTILYIGYSLLLAIAIMVATGCVGFVSSFCFVHYLFSSTKAV